MPSALASIRFCPNSPIEPSASAAPASPATPASAGVVRGEAARAITTDCSSAGVSPVVGFRPSSVTGDPASIASSRGSFGGRMLAAALEPNTAASLATTAEACARLSMPISRFMDFCGLSASRFLAMAPSSGVEGNEIQAEYISPHCTVKSRREAFRFCLAPKPHSSTISRFCRRKRRRLTNARR